jgi:ABC-type multidrug transport system fused ATPase/permease subunit
MGRKSVLALQRQLRTKAVTISDLSKPGAVPLTARQPITRLQLVGYLFCPPLYIMITLMVAEALLAASTTWLIIRAGRAVATDALLAGDLISIFIAQSASYIAGALSWYFAERAGFRAFGRYMLQFARDNRSYTRLLPDKQTREQVEPFLTSTTFINIFNFMYEVEDQLKLLLGLIFNSIVLGVEIDAGLPVAYAATFVILLTIQWSVRRRIADIYLENQRQNNRLIAHGYTAWDNVFSGNRYNWRLWLGGFKSKLRDCFRAQVSAIMAREGLSTMGGVIGLAIVFSSLTYVVIANAGETEVLVALAATLPRQIEMTNQVHQLTSGWNDVLALWTRLGGVARSMRPEPDPNFDRRINFDRLVLREDGRSHVCSSVEEAMRLVLAKRRGRVLVRGGNGSGKSTLLAALKAEIKNRAYYWPTTDRLAFRFAIQVLDEPQVFENDEDEPRLMKSKQAGFSSGERQLRSLDEIVHHTDAAIYLLDEWDANLDPSNRAMADALMQQLAHRARVVEISHRDQE